MMNNFGWNYTPTDPQTNDLGLLKEGDYRVRIDEAIPTTAKNGTDGLAITLTVNGETRKLKHYIWFNYDDAERTNRHLGAFFNSFDIDPHEEPWCEPWIDKTGAVHVVHSDYKGRKIAKVAYCIARSKQDKLPEWQDEVTHDETEEPKSSFIEARAAAIQATSWEDFHF